MSNQSTMVPGTSNKQETVDVIDYLWVSRRHNIIPGNLFEDQTQRFSTRQRSML